MQASRRGHRAHLRKLIKKAEEIVERRANIDEFLIAAAKSTTDQLQRKRDMLRALNEKILPNIEKAECVEDKIIEAEGIEEESQRKLLS